MNLVDRLAKVEDQYKKLSRRLKCLAQPFPTFDDFPPIGCEGYLYIDESTDPNEIWRWDNDLQIYVQAGGGGGGALEGPGLQFSQYSSDLDIGLVNFAALDDTPEAIPFSAVVNVGTHVVGNLATNDFTVTEDGWYNFYFDATFQSAIAGQLVGQLFINASIDYDYEVSTNSTGYTPEGLAHLSFTRKLNLSAGDVISFVVFRPIVDGASAVVFSSVEMSLERISLGAIVLGGNGLSVLNGTIDPTTEGVNGEFYINTTTNQIFGPKTAGAWGTGTSLVGPAGPPGPVGLTGPKGDQGDPGLGLNFVLESVDSFDSLNPLNGWVQPPLVDGSSAVVKFSDGSVVYYICDGLSWLFMFVDVQIPLNEVVYGNVNNLKSDSSFTKTGNTVFIKSSANDGSLIIEKDPTGQSGFSPPLLIQDKENTIYPPTRNTGILFEVRANNSPPIGRPVFQVQGEGAVRIWDYLTILPSLLPITQWFPEPSILQVGSDLSGTPGAVNIVVQNQRDSEVGAQGGHPFMKFVDMNSGLSGTIPGEPRLYITGGGSLKYGEDSVNSPNLVPFWPGDAYVIDGPKQPNFAIRNAVGQRGTEFGGIYTKFTAVQNDIYYINSGGGVENFINRSDLDGSITINNEKKLQIYDGIHIGNKTGVDGIITSSYGGINFLNTKIGYNISPVYKIDINSNDDYPLRLQTPTSLLDFRQNISFNSPGTTTAVNSIGNLPTSTLNLWSTTAEAEHVGSSISFGSYSKSGVLVNPYIYGQIHVSKKGASSDYAGKFRFLTVASNSTSDYRLEISETEVDVNTSLKITKTFATDGTGVANGSMFKGTDGALYYKGGGGTVTLIGPN